MLFLYLGLISSRAIDIKPNDQRIEKFVNEQGFYQNTVNAIISDEDGNLWIATPNGLVRYDGYTFDYYYSNHENRESLPNNYITNLIRDSEGVLWIGTMQGLCLYFSDKEKFIPLGDTPGNITILKEDPRKRIWVGNGFVLHIYNAGSIQSENIKKAGEIDLNKQLEGEWITDLEFLSDSVLVIATSLELYEVTFHETDNYSVEVLPLSFDYLGNEIRKIIKIENSFWIGTSAGLYHTFKDNNRLITVKTYFNSNEELLNQQYRILSLYLDEENNLWIGTAQNGYLKFNMQNGDFTSFNYDPKIENGLTSKRINCFHEDAFGVMWIGTAQGGINKLDKHQKPFYGYSQNPYDNQSISGNLITDIAEDKEGRIWISFFNNPICRTTEKIDLEKGTPLRFQRLEKQFKQLMHQWVVCIFQDSKGFWWIGTDVGVYLYDEGKEKLIQVQFNSGDKKLNVSQNRVITQIDPHHILIGGQKVFMLNDPWGAILSNIPVQINNRILNLEKEGPVNDFALDDFGNIWIGTTLNGIYQLALEQEELVVKLHMTSSSKEKNLQLSHDIIFSIYNDQNKDIWVGTFGGGLMKIQLDTAGNPEKIKSFHRKDGLPDEAIYGILKDENGIFWLSTDMGICQFNTISEKFDVYDVNDGMLNYNFRQSSYLKTTSGIILMGGLNGLTVFNPNQIKKNEIPPVVKLSRLKVNNQPIIAGRKFDKKNILEKPISDIEKLVLDHRNRNISLDIIVHHNSAPQKNQLAYMLENVNKEWIEVEEGKATATYTNLSAGTYRFLYKGANGLWI